jgi:hypothetical protein
MRSAIRRMSGFRLRKSSVTDLNLFLIIMSVFAMVIYLIVTNPASEQDVREMLDDEEMWP